MPCDVLERLAARHNSGPVWIDGGAHAPTGSEDSGHSSRTWWPWIIRSCWTESLVFPTFRQLLHCAQARANYMLRMIPPEAVREHTELFQCVLPLSHCGDEETRCGRRPDSL